ncbi:MAG: hypothetical protein V4737_12890 [Curtobacterium sp.]
MTEQDLADISPANRTAGTVMAGVALLLMQDPQLSAMAAENDKQRFVEGCQNAPWFRQKFAQALMQIRETALAA